MCGSWPKSEMPEAMPAFLGDWRKSLGHFMLLRREQSMVQAQALENRRANFAKPSVGSGGCYVYMHPHEARWVASTVARLDLVQCYEALACFGMVDATELVRGGFLRCMRAKGDASPSTTVACHTAPDPIAPSRLRARTYRCRLTEVAEGQDLMSGNGGCGPGTIRHVWTAPPVQGFLWFGRMVGCGHVSGLFARC